MRQPSPLNHMLDWFARLWIAGLVVCVCALVLLAAMRWLILPLNAPVPAVSGLVPADGTTDVAPRSVISIAFGTPMNPASVEQALAITPPMAARLSWNAANDTLTISPTETLAPATSYRITITTDALGSAYRSLEQPFAAAFTTAPAPRVVAIFPPDGSRNITLDAPVGVVFSGLMIAPEHIRRPMTLPALQFNPPINGIVHWLDQHSLLFMPTEPLRPATRYEAVLSGTLADVGGGQIGQDIRWSFSTPPPRVLAVAPVPGALVSAPDAALTLTVSQELDLNTIRDHLRITPAISGSVTTARLLDGSQIITFTPERDWEAGVSYLAELTPGALPRRGNLPLEAGFVWSFDVSAQPELRGRFPGEGQILPIGQDVRLIFSTPMDQERLSNTLLFEPPLPGLRVIGTGREVRISADFAPSTLYTITIPAALSDTTGLNLEREYTLRFRTAPPEPAISLPDAVGNWLQSVPEQPLTLRLRTIRVSRTELELYRFDPVTLERTVNFRPADWQTFDPERYQLPLIGLWSIPLSSTAELPIETQATLVLTDGANLPPGAYYLRAQTPEGPRADLVVLVSPIQLLLHTAPGGLLIWATDLRSGMPLSGVSLHVLQEGTTIARGLTDINGLLSLSSRSTDLRRPIIVLGTSTQDEPGIIGIWPSDALRLLPYRLSALLDRAVYQPGETVQLAGAVRRAYTPGDARVPAGLQIQYAIRPRQLPGMSFSGTFILTDSGVISMAITLPSDATPGIYDLFVRLDGNEQRLSFAVEPDAPALSVQVQSATPNTPTATLRWDIQAATPEGLPPSAATFDWALEVLAPPRPALIGFVFGEAPATTAPLQTGRGTLDANGRTSLTLRLPDGARDGNRYRLTVRVIEPNGLSGSGSAIQDSPPAYVLAGINLPLQVVPAGRASDLLVATVDHDGALLSGVRALVTVQHRVRNPQTAQIENNDILRRTVTTGSGGLVRLSLTPPRPGEYVVQVVSENSTISSSATLYVTAPDFTDWPTPGLLIPEQATYPPGAEVRLLTTTPISSEAVLLIQAGSANLRSEVRTVRPDTLITTTLQADDPNGLLIGLVQPQTATIGVPVPRILQTPISIGVLTQSLELLVELPPPDAGTASVTITTRTTGGLPQPADLLLRIVPQGAQPATLLPAPQAALSLETARWPGIRGMRNPDAAPLPGESVRPAEQDGATDGLILHLRSGADGIARVPLEQLHSNRCTNTDAPAPCVLRLEVVAVDDTGQVAMVDRLLPALPLVLASDMPAFVRPGDELDLRTHIVRTFAPPTVTVRLESDGGTTSPLEQTITDSRVLTWPLRIRPNERLRIQIRAITAHGISTTQILERPVLQTPPVPTETPGGVGVLRELIDPTSGAVLNPATIRIGQIIQVRLTVLLSEATATITLVEALPSGTSLLRSDPNLQYDATHGILRWELPPAPGIYRATYILRATFSGRFGMPEPLLSHPDRTAAIVGDSMILRVMP